MKRCRVSAAGLAHPLSDAPPSPAPLSRFITVTHYAANWLEFADCPRREDVMYREKTEEPNTEHLLLLAACCHQQERQCPTMNSLTLDVKVSSYVHFICKSSREEDLRHRV